MINKNKLWFHTLLLLFLSFTTFNLVEAAGSKTVLWATTWCVKVWVNCNDVWLAWSDSCNNFNPLIVCENWPWIIEIADNAWNITEFPYNVNSIVDDNFILDNFNAEWSLDYMNWVSTTNCVKVSAKCSDIWLAWNCEVEEKIVCENWSWTIPVKDSAWNITEIPYIVDSIIEKQPNWALHYESSYEQFNELTSWKCITASITCEDVWLAWCILPDPVTSCTNASWLFDVYDEAWNLTQVPYHINSNWTDRKSVV